MILRLCWKFYSFLAIQEMLHICEILICITVFRRAHCCALSYPQGSIDSVVNSKGNSRPNKEETLQGSAYIPYVKGVPETFRRICLWLYSLCGPRPPVQLHRR
jgi:hypothetical protein